MKKDISEWDSGAYTDYKLNQEADDNLLENPIQIEEGSIQCGKCKEWKCIPDKLYFLNLLIFFLSMSFKNVLNDIMVIVTGIHKTLFYLN